MRRVLALVEADGFPALVPWPDDPTGALNATDTRSDGVRFQFYGRTHVSFWVEVPAADQA